MGSGELGPDFDSAINPGGDLRQREPSLSEPQFCPVSCEDVDHGSPQPLQLALLEVCWFRDCREGRLFSEADIGWAPPCGRRFTC